MKYDYMKKDGTCPLYIYVSIDGHYDRIPLKLSWPPSQFDKDAGSILARGKDDKDFSDYQLIIDSELAKVNEIMKDYRLSNRTLTIEMLIKEYNSYTSRKDFFSFYENDAKERYKRKKIEKNTRDGHIATLHKLKEFWKKELEVKTKKKKSVPIELQDAPPLPFNALTPKLLENFRAFLKNVYDNAPGTVEKGMKDVRTYVKRALVEKNVFDDPFKVVKVTKPETFPNALTQEDLQVLMNIFQDKTTPENWQLVLRHFLFSCFTGLRISDARAVSHENIKSGWLVITQHKNRNTLYKKTIRVPLHSMAKTLVQTSLGRLFDTFSEQYTNRVLDKIGKAANLDFKPTTHTARHTFGTLFIELGGDVVTLKDYMGHSKIETTMKYVHISEKRKAEKINVFDKLFQQ